ncbi:hypothetical protein GCM10028791_08960 [Echinicola sediminis]
MSSNTKHIELPKNGDKSTGENVPFSPVCYLNDSEINPDYHYFTPKKISKPGSKGLVKKQQETSKDQ